MKWHRITTALLITCLALAPVNCHAEIVKLDLISEKELPAEKQKVIFTGGTASSTINQQAEYHNTTVTTVSCLYDGDEKTSWQEGVDGLGIGEGFTLYMDHSYPVRYLSFKLGNWKSDKYYYGNARPSSLIIYIGGTQYKVKFPNEWKEFFVALPEPVEDDKLNVTIDDAYYGNSWTDTCIAELTAYAEYSDVSAEAANAASGSDTYNSEICAEAPPQANSEVCAEAPSQDNSEVCAESAAANMEAKDTNGEFPASGEAYQGIFFNQRTYLSINLYTSTEVGGPVGIVYQVKKPTQASDGNVNAQVIRKIGELTHDGSSYQIDGDSHDFDISFKDKQIVLSGYAPMDGEYKQVSNAGVNMSVKDMWLELDE